MVNLVAVILINIYNVFFPIDDDLMKIFARCPVLVNFLLFLSWFLLGLMMLMQTCELNDSVMMLNILGRLLQFLCILNKTALSQSLL
jgi:hypothetical protein